MIEVMTEEMVETGREMVETKGIERGNGVIETEVDTLAVVTTTVVPVQTPYVTHSW